VLKKNLVVKNKKKKFKKIRSNSLFFKLYNLIYYKRNYNIVFDKDYYKRYNIIYQKIVELFYNIKYKNNVRLMYKKLYKILFFNDRYRNKYSKLTGIYNKIYNKILNKSYYKGSKYSYLLYKMFNKSFYKIFNLLRILFRKSSEKYTFSRKHKNNKLLKEIFKSIKLYNKIFVYIKYYKNLRKLIKNKKFDKNSKYYMLMVFFRNNIIKLTSLNNIKKT
jgi:hypothetical protein